MSLAVLLIDNDPRHAQAVAHALAHTDPEWQVNVVSSLADVEDHWARQRPDVVLVAQQAVERAGIELLQGLYSVPKLIILRPGAEAHVAHSLCDGFDGVAVRDPARDYLQTLSVQIKGLLERHSASPALADAQTLLSRQHRLLQSISRAQSVFIASSGPKAAFDVLLKDFLQLTQSAFGLVGQVQRAADGHPYLLVHSLSDIAWDEESRQRYAQHAQGGMAFDSLQSLLGAPLLSGQPVISNDASNDPRGAGVPHGHPPLRTYLGVPIYASGELVAMVGLANRAAGYTQSDIDFLQPLLNAVGQLETARRAELTRTAVQADLARTTALLKEKTRFLEGTLASVEQGISNVDAQGRIQLYNQRYLELLDLPERLLAGRPLVEEVVQFQAHRGDFGPGYQSIDPVARGYVAAEYAARGGNLEMPSVYVRRTHSGRFIEVRTRQLAEGGRVRTFTDVTDYLGTVEALRLSEARWRSLTQLSSDWYWEQDAQFRFVRLDGNAQQFTGITDESTYGLTSWELPDAQVAQGQWAVHRAQLEAHEVFHDFEMQRSNSVGKAVWVSISGEPIFDGEGQFTGYRGVARDITDRKLAEAEIQRLAFYDELTDLPNRRLLMDRLERAVALSEREGTHGALLFLDLDNFKDLNDTKGHEWGDLLLVQVARRISANVRATDTVARLGGDEFVVVLQSLGALELKAVAEAKAIAQKILMALNQPYVLASYEIHSTPSIGITLFQGHHQSPQELLKRADLAMYQAKAAGRNALCFFDPSMQAAASARSALEGDIRLGIQRQEFLLHYQPVVNDTGQVLGAEALVRWCHPERGIVSPADFIPLAEQTGLILPLGKQVLTMACTQLARWATSPTTAAWSLAVNVSAVEFRQPDFVQQVLLALRDSGADPSRLKLELTESMLLNDVEESILKMHDLRSQGVRFSLDDFGTGYSSLSYLKRLPLHQLKIDQSFVRDVLTDPNNATIARTIITLAQSLGLDVVAEGVETEGQRLFLFNNGCRQFQGYFFGRPAPALELLSVGR